MDVFLHAFVAPSYAQESILYIIGLNPELK